MNKQVIIDKYSKAAAAETSLCCPVDYRQEFGADELSHIPEEVLERNYGCGVPPELKRLKAGQSVLDLGPGLGRDCFIAARKVGPEGRVYGLDMNDDMLQQAERHKAYVVRQLGYDNLRFLKGQFDVEIPLQDQTVDVIFSNCVNNLALDKPAAYREMFRVLKSGQKLSFVDVVSCQTLPAALRRHQAAWADCAGGVLSFAELVAVLRETGFHGVTLTPHYLWMTGEQILEGYFSGNGKLSARQHKQLEAVRLYSVGIEACKPTVDPKGECFWRGQYALYHGPGVSCQLDDDPDHVFQTGVLKEVCEKTATLLKSEPFQQHFTVFEPRGEVEPRLCVPGGSCC